MSSIDKMVPHTVFIVPYRDREEHKKIFLNKMEEVFEYYNWKKEDVHIYFSHQKDKRLFNRGAVKNIGFLAIKNRYPRDYKNITFIFNDVDTIPSDPSLIPYKTNKGVVSHYYGYDYALGGIFAIKGDDFENINGFPNFWGWGLEDNCLNDRCKQNNLIIDRSIFYNIRDRRIIHSFDEFTKIYSQRETNIYKKETPDTIEDLTNINYIFNDNVIDILTFDTKRQPDKSEMALHDIRKGSRIQLNRKFFRKNWGMNAIFK